MVFQTRAHGHEGDPVVLLVGHSIAQSPRTFTLLLLLGLSASMLLVLRSHAWKWLFATPSPWAPLPWFYRKLAI